MEGFDDMLPDDFLSFTSCFDLRVLRVEKEGKFVNNRASMCDVDLKCKRLFGHGFFNTRRIAGNWDLFEQM